MRAWLGLWAHKSGSLLLSEKFLMGRNEDHFPCACGNLYPLPSFSPSGSVPS
jgi:hypothetical protein